MTRPLVLAILLLSGCAMVDHNSRVPDWPNLVQQVNVVSREVMLKHCSKYGSIGAVVFACTEIWFDPPLCKIWVTEAGGWAEAHERMHCLGHEHIGGTGLNDMWVKYKERR